MHWAWEGIAIFQRNNGVARSGPAAWKLCPNLRLTSDAGSLEQKLENAVVNVLVANQEHRGTKRFSTLYLILNA